MNEFHLAVLAMVSNHNRRQGPLDLTAAGRTTRQCASDLLCMCHLSGTLGRLEITNTGRKFLAKHGDDRGVFPLQPTGK